MFNDKINPYLVVHSPRNALTNDLSDKNITNNSSNPKKTGNPTSLPNKKNQEEGNVSQSKDPSEIPRCFWCNKEESEGLSLQEATIQRKRNSESKTIFYCQEEHKQKVISFYNFVDQGMPFFQVLICYLPVILIIFYVIFRYYIIFFGIFISLGIALLVFPLLGDRTAQDLGLHKTIILGRILGGMLLIIGLVLTLTIGLVF
ncbi:MAG: hypothetical protein GF308_05010 [Candidatus Heimdallarchaeota archaeon]|nr:hypothetical protein [Candidatus Heimdallarchaeota archaeon]